MVFFLLETYYSAYIYDFDFLLFHICLVLNPGQTSFELLVYLDIFYLLYLIQHHEANINILDHLNLFYLFIGCGLCFMVFNATFNNISHKSCIEHTSNLWYSLDKNGKKNCIQIGLNIKIVIIGRWFFWPL
jgi:hypothetical protein